MKVLKTLVASAALCMAGAVAAAPSSIWFDGYCDGISNIMINDNGTVTGTYDLSGCGAESSQSIGQRASANRMMGSTGHYVGYDYILVRINDNGTWVYYWDDGSYMNGGTWTAGDGARAAAPTDRRSTTPR